MFNLRELLVVLFLITLIDATVIKYAHEANKLIKYPTISDLSVYLKSLKRISDFCSQNKYDLDMNFVFGLFLVNVNIKQALKRRDNIPKSIYDYASLIVQKNNELLHFFDNMVHRDGDSRDRLNKKIISLFSNETTWMERLQGFETSGNVWDLRKNTNLSDKRVSISEYISRVDDLDNWVPSPQLSDICMISLANNRDYDSGSIPRCSLYEPCYDMLVNGTDFGYALSHRMLLLMNAKHGRGCAIFSEHQDMKLRKKLCSIAYTESKFIADNGYVIVDLILEMMALCGLDGHIQFLRRAWFQQILKFQSDLGCFGVTVPKPSFKPPSPPRPAKSWRLAKHRDHQILGGLCNGHVTSVAAAALGVAVRYIFETV